MKNDRYEIYLGGISMDYNALIQNRKSARQFTDKEVGEAVCNQLESYYQNSCQRLVPGISTELWIFGDNTRQALEGEDHILAGKKFFPLVHK